ncbi:unnamed protein product [Thelazia callipaeda]|uniref:Beta_helix domain-containing protein n=1 Tax=Thelazia callipaeda TaxID=103827 RepID=A0A158RBE1_THECL|nr:unnamed protein product [Thelazia callipaeda]
MINVDGREPFMGSFTKLTFRSPRCIASITVDSLTTLTGAEEVELIYKVCENDTAWYLTHYISSGNEFTLHFPIYAQVFVVVTRRGYRIIDVGVKSCNNTNLEEKRIPKKVHTCTQANGKILRKRRKHHNERFLVQERHGRVKRSMQISNTLEFRAQSSPHQILKNITIAAGDILKIHSGTHMQFAPNTGILAFGTLQIVGTSNKPVLLYPINNTWYGLQAIFTDANVAKESKLVYVNISGSSNGICIKSPILPKIHNVISDSNGNGLIILIQKNYNESNYPFDWVLRRITTINNRANGLVISAEANQLIKVILKEVLSASNQANGLVLQGNFFVTVNSSQFFANTKNGISSYLSSNSALEITDSTFGSNGLHSVHIPSSQQIRFKFLHSTFKAHNFETVIMVEFANQSNFLLDNCHGWNNNAGGIAFLQVIDSDLLFLKSSWTRNRGSIIFIDQIQGKTNILIEDNNFDRNFFLNTSALNAVIQIRMTESDKDVRVRLYGNRMQNNAMENILQISRIVGPHIQATNAKITIIKNIFVENMAIDTVYLATNFVNISRNTFDNPKAQCELRSGQKQSKDLIDARNNYWSSVDEEEPFGQDVNPNCCSTISKHECGYIIRSFDQETTKIDFKNVRFDKSVEIERNENAVFHEGSVLAFKPGHGIIVSGALHLLGVRENPILLRNFGGTSWLGIILKPGGTLYANYCILQSAVIALNISSSQIHIKNIQIIRPIVSGILITTIYNGDFDMGQTRIVQSHKNGIEILERETNSSICLRNAVIMDSAQAGIDIMVPAGNITIQNIVLENNGLYGIRLVQSRNKELDSIRLSNLTIRKQVKGDTGILLNLKSYSLLHLNTSNFIFNALPSIALFTKCQKNIKNKKVPNVLIEKNRFWKNDNLVMRVSIENCGNTKIRRNIFINNNEFGENGALTVQISPQEMQPELSIDITENIFVKNKGDWSMFVSATNLNPFHGTIYYNRFNGNQNSRESPLIVKSSQLHVHANQFDDRMFFDQFDFHIDPLEDDLTDMDDNYWKDDDMQNVANFAFSDKWNQSEAHLSAISRKRAAEDDCLAVSNCSNHGQCIGLNDCHCNSGYSGLDCSQSTCIELQNCSMNGYCVGPNLCKCFEGWQKEDCSTPTCHLLNNCSGHGACADCSKRVDNCTWRGCNNHGLCVGGQCICESGWTDPFCSSALCDELNDCSGSGNCIRPQVCECFHGYKGDDCSICLGPHCHSCNVVCVHGRCNPNTKTCVCRNGWIGMSCNICASGKCDSVSAVLYVQPTAAGIHQKNQSILVYGNDLPQLAVPSKRYTCLYGSTASDGFFISSSLIRCTTPTSVLPGRYLFNLVPYGSNMAIPFLDRRLIHFTFYNECQQVNCKGYCVGGTCICPADRDGLNCEQTRNISKVHSETLNNEKLLEAVEGEPYTVKLPSQQDNTIFTVETDAHGMVVYPNGMVFWAQPIGRAEAYVVNVRAVSLTTENVINWNLTVKPTYDAIVTKVENIDDSNMKLIKGTVIYNVKVAMHPSITNLENITFKNNVTWNGYSFEIECDPKIMVDPGRQVDANYHIKNNGQLLLVNCQVVLIAPRDKMQILKYEKVLRTIASGESARITITFIADNNIDDTTIILQFKCIDTLKKLVKQQVQVPRAKPDFAFYPKEIVISSSSRICPKIISVDIVNNKGYEFTNMPKIIIRPDNTSLFLVSTKPLLQNLTNFSTSGSILTLSFSYQSLISSITPGNLSLSGDIVFLDDSKPQFTIPYHSMHATSDLFDFYVIVRDELNALNPNYIIDDAQIFLQNDVHSYNDRRQTKMNEPIVFFSIVEGTYQLTVTSPTHETVILIVQASVANSSISVFLPLCQSLSPVVEDRKLSLEKIEKQYKMSFPEIYLIPSSILAPQNGTKMVKLIVQSDDKGANGSIIILPSVEIYNQYLSFSLATPEFNNSLGPGDGYPIYYQLSYLSEKIMNNIECNTFVVQIPYIYMIQNLMTNYAQNIQVLVDQRDNEAQAIHLCKVGLEMAVKEISIWSKTMIHCDCATKTKEICRQKYVSAAMCGSSWKYIPDDTVTLETIAMFIAMIAECQANQVDFQKMKQLLSCAASLDNRCSINRHRRTLKIRSTTDRRERGQFFDQLSLVDEQADGMLHKYFPVLNVLRLEAVNTPALYYAFFEQLNILLPFKYFEKIKSREWYDKFFEYISESSENGLAISEAEYTTLKNEGSMDLIHRWNATVREWLMGSDPFIETHHLAGIKFTDLRELVIRSDRLKTLTKQYGAENPFALLHNYMERLLSAEMENHSGFQKFTKTEDDYNDVCAIAYALITPEKLFEYNEFYLKLKVINKKKDPLEFVKLTLEMAQNRDDNIPIQFFIELFKLDGIDSISGSSKLPANSALTAYWRLKPRRTTRLIRETEYQAILNLKFTRNGHRNVQRIETQTVIYRPRPSLKMYYFFSNLTSSENTTNLDSLSSNFSVMVAFINAGYSNLRNVKVEETRISIVSTNTKQSFIPYQQAKIAYFKLTISMDGKLLELEDSRTFVIHQLIAPEKFLISPNTIPNSFYYYDKEKTIMRTITPLHFVKLDEKRGVSDGKSFRQQIASFELNELTQPLTSFYARVPFPRDLDTNVEVLRVNQIGNDGILNLVDPRHVWNSNDGENFVHFIDENPLTSSKIITYEIIYGNAEVFLRPRFEFPTYNIPLVLEHWPQIGDTIAKITATSPSQSVLRYELYTNSSRANDYFGINPITGEITLKKDITPSKDGYCMTARATDDHGRSEATVITIGLDVSHHECQKIDDFNELQPLIHIPSQFNFSKTTVQSDSATTGTTRILQLINSSDPSYFTPSLSSPLIITESSITDSTLSSRFPVNKKYQYTTLIAIQSNNKFNSSYEFSSTSDMVLSTSIEFESSSAANNIDTDVDFTSTTVSTNDAISNESKTSISNKNSDDELLFVTVSADGINNVTITPENIDSIKTDTVQPETQYTQNVGEKTYITDRQKNETYPMHSTYEVTPITDKDVTNSFTLQNTTNNIKESEVEKSTFSTIINEVTKSNGTMNDNFGSTEGTLQETIYTPNSEMTDKAGSEYLESFKSQTVSDQSTDLSSSSTQQITLSSDQNNNDVKPNAVSVLGSLSSLLRSNTGMALDAENITKIQKIVCHLKSVKPIWSLICDLSKTIRIKRVAKTKI